MSGVSHDYIEDYLRSLVKDHQGKLQEIEAYGVENNVPIIHKEVAQFLKVIIKSHNVKKILEVGTAIGYSASVMIDAAGSDSHVTSIERSEDMYKLATENIKSQGFENNANLIFGDALEVLKDVEGEFDMIFLDAAKGHYDHFLEECLKKLKVGGLLVSDNVLFRGMVASNDLLIRRKITIVKRMRKFLSHISSVDHLETTILPIGDGVALTCKLRRDENE
ncbi:MAG: O-methyltransferase [Clostridium sp.]|uniref:O-methyltransferase n=1 Tax=Clostridium sp. TaxID=1506 RepID=UPI002FC598DF